MKFKRVYTRKTDEISAIYIRFRYPSLNHCNYIGQTINVLDGRPFRTNAYGRKLQGWGKWQSLILLRCPLKRLDVREAYFILKFRPSDMKLTTYFKRAWYLLKKNEMLFILTKYLLIKKEHSLGDWKRICSCINEIGKSNDQKEHYEILKNLHLSIIHENLERSIIDQQKIKNGELLDITSTLEQQTIWAKNFCRKFGGFEFTGFKNPEKGMF